MNNSASGHREITCQLQASLGALDRVLGLLTHRGILPTTMQTELKGDFVYLNLVFTCADDWDFLKLIKAIEKQVCTIQVTPNSESILAA